MSPATDDRTARRKRAQSDARRRGNERAAQLQSALDKSAEAISEPPSGQTDPTAALVVSKDAESVPDKPKRLVEPDTAAAQARRAAAKIEAAETARKSKSSTARVVPPRATTTSASTSKPSASKSPSKTAARREPAKRARTTTPVVPVKIEQAVEQLQIEYVQCRDFGHSWRPYSARWMPTFNQYESQLLCARCKTIRTRFLSRTGGLLESKYDYAEGYTVKGLGRLSGSDRDVIRLHSLLSVLTEDTAE